MWHQQDRGLGGPNACIPHKSNKNNKWATTNQCKLLWESSGLQWNSSRNPADCKNWGWPCKKAWERFYLHHLILQFRAAWHPQKFLQMDFTPWGEEEQENPSKLHHHRGLQHLLLRTSTVFTNTDYSRQSCPESLLLCLSWGWKCCCGEIWHLGPHHSGTWLSLVELRQCLTIYENGAPALCPAHRY